MRTLQEKWDKKAQSYNRYTTDTNALEETICGYIRKAGIDLEAKRILDIGCGTGAYTLRVAQKASHIDAVDVSSEMLRILREDASNLKIETIDTHQSTWEDFSLTHAPYDIAMATMFPALKEDAHFQKMHEAAHTKLFLGWGGKRGTELIEALFKAHGGDYQAPNSATVLKLWLTQQGIHYRVIEHTEEKVRVRDFEKAIENYSWHLKIRGMPPQKEAISSILKKYQNVEGNVVERTLNDLNLIIW